MGGWERQSQKDRENETGEKNPPYSFHSECRPHHLKQADITTQEPSSCRAHLQTQSQTFHPCLLFTFLCLTLSLSLSPALLRFKPSPSAGCLFSCSFALGGVYICSGAGDAGECVLERVCKFSARIKASAVDKHLVFASSVYLQSRQCFLERFGLYMVLYRVAFCLCAVQSLFQMQL